MGAYFSLRGAGEWDKTVSETMLPSIWTNVSFTPLTRSQKLLLHRGDEVEFHFPAGISQGGDTINFSDVADLSVIIGLHESVGRFYSGLLLHAPLREQPHCYSRAVAEMVLKAPSSQPQRGSRPSPKARGPMPDEPFSGSILGSMMCDEEQCASSTEWPYLLLYVVKEGVLAFFASDYESCEQVIRDVAASYSEPAADGSPGKRDQVRCLCYPVGRAPPPVGRAACELIGTDLKRDFAVRCEAAEQAHSTNCVVFCLRMMLGFKMSVRGFDINTVCESDPALGPLVGRAAGDAWEVLWRRVRT